MRNKTTTTLYRWFQEVWSNGNKNALDELLTQDVVAHGLYPDDRPQGIDSFKKFYEEFRSQLTNINVAVEDVIAQDDMEVALCSVTATDIATNKAVSFGGLCMAQIRDGKIAQAWNHYDFLKMYQQLGMTLNAQ